MPETPSPRRWGLLLLVIGAVVEALGVLLIVGGRLTPGAGLVAAAALALQLPGIVLLVRSPRR